MKAFLSKARLWRGQPILIGLKAGTTRGPVSRPETAIAVSMDGRSKALTPLELGIESAGAIAYETLDLEAGEYQIHLRFANEEVRIAEFLRLLEAHDYVRVCHTITVTDLP